MSDQIWVLGATGRSGRSTAQRLHAMGHRLVVAGRDHERLRVLAATLGHADVVSGSLDELLSQIHDAAPVVVVNTVGPFAQTTSRVIEACPPGTNYVDIANELPALVHALDEHAASVERGRTVVVGAGFGVLATETLVVKMCAERPGPTRVRVDAIPSLAVTDGVIGSALAGSVLDGLPDGGRHVDRGKLVRAPIAGQRQHLTSPNGDSVTTAELPTGDLLAAWRASNADSVVSASAMIPSGPAVRAALPVLSLLLRPAVVRRFAVNRFAAIRMRPEAMPRQFSWGHCTMEWADGTRREAWLRLGDAQEFTVAATAEVAHRLAGPGVPHGAYTPAALFGPPLAEELGATFVM